MTAGLPSVDLPTLVLVGTADILTPPRDSRQITALLPDARLAELTGAGHMLMYERTEEVDRLMIDFARECSRFSGDQRTSERAVGQ